MAHLTDVKTRPVTRPLTARLATPMTITVRLGGRVEIALPGLPAGLRDRLRRTAAFANPEFFERERARLSTHKTPERAGLCRRASGGLDDSSRQTRPDAGCWLPRSTVGPTPRAASASRCAVRS